MFTETPPLIKEGATYQDILALPPNLTGELLEGTMVALPRPRGRHLKSTSRLGGLLTVNFDLGLAKPDGWWIIDEPELHLGRNVLTPDLAGWTHATLPEFPDQPYYEIAPDWVCEVLSPSTAALDRTRKLRIYKQHEVDYVWLIDPLAHTVEVLFRKDRSWILLDVAGESERVRLAPFEALELDLSLLWIKR